jgi:hypothetical protein
MQRNRGISHFQDHDGYFKFETKLYKPFRAPLPVHDSCYEVLSKVLDYRYGAHVNLDVLFSALSQVVSSSMLISKKGILDLDYYEMNSIISEIGLKFRSGHGEDVSDDHSSLK